MPYARTFDGPAAAADLTGLFHHQLALSRVKRGESVVCVTDTAWNPVYGAACLAAALSLGADASLLTLPASRPPPPAMLGAALAAAEEAAGGGKGAPRWPADVLCCAVLCWLMLLRRRACC